MAGSTQLTERRVYPAGSLGELLLRLDRQCFDAPDDEVLRWPPDAFCLAAAALKLSGGYVQVLSEWPPSFRRPRAESESWLSWIRQLGRDWRKAAVRRSAVPRGVKDLWRTLRAGAGAPLRTLRDDRALCCALLELLAAADEASAGAGIPHGAHSDDRFLQEAAALLNDFDGGSSLSRRVDKAYARVLPKHHTPRSGLTLRSLSHHLALHQGTEVTPFWYTVPQPWETSLNLLVAPWPLEILPNQFRPDHGALREMPQGFGFMAYHPQRQPDAVASWTRELIREARRVGGRVDGVVFPELGLSEDEYAAVKQVVLESDAFLISGVLADAEPAGRNLVAFDARVERGVEVHLEQLKHHRWRLDRPQVEMYGLGGNLDPNRDWWEHVAVGERQVNFISLNGKLSVCCLICEDLARQDPVAELVRSVGPNLVIALLMDGPQLGVRWPARYATVLADDPGSSVLTVTSAGMVGLTRPPPGARASRSVALWKDARSNLIEIDLTEGAGGVLLSLCSESVEEWAADGRTDRGVTGYPRLAGIHPIRVKPAPPAARRRGKARSG